MHQLDILAKQAIDHAASGADAQWWREAAAAISLLCKRGTPFTTDAVWFLLDKSGVKTHDPRALGAVVRAACKDGLIRPTGEYHKSTRKECHRRPLAVWRPVISRKVSNGL